MGRPRTKKVSTPPAAPRVISPDEIARRAYDLYLARGREDGHDLDDWLRAERELRAVAV